MLHSKSSEDIRCLYAKKSVKHKVLIAENDPESEQLNPFTKGPSRSPLAKGTFDGHFTEVPGGLF